MAGMEDWYEIMLENGVGEHGCCILCDDAEPGCLCYTCKCRQCVHYEADDGFGDGYCTLADEWRSNPIKPDTHYKIGQLERETDKAVLATIIKLPQKILLSTKYWIPKSIIIDKFYVPRWFSKKTFTEHISYQSNLNPRRIE